MDNTPTNNSFGTTYSASKNHRKFNFSVEIHSHNTHSFFYCKMGNVSVMPSVDYDEKFNHLEKRADILYLVIIHGNASILVIS